MLRLLILLWGLALAAGAQEPEPEPEPTPLVVWGTKLNTTTANTQAPGHVKLSFLYTQQDATDRFGTDGRLRPLVGSDRRSEITARIQVGLVEDLDLSVLSGRVLVSRQRQDAQTGLSETAEGEGTSDLAIVLRWRFVNDKEDGLYAALLSGPSFSSRPNGNQLLVGQGFNSWRESLVVQKDWGRFTTSAQVYYVFPNDTSKLAYQSFGANLALGYQAADWAQPEVELNYQTTGLPRQVLAVTAGSNFGLTDQLHLLLGVQKTLNGANVNARTRLQGSLQVSF